MSVALLRLPSTQSMTFTPLVEPFPWDILADRADNQHDTLSEVDSSLVEIQKQIIDEIVVVRWRYNFVPPNNHSYSCDNYTMSPNWCGQFDDFTLADAPLASENCCACESNCDDDGSFLSIAGDTCLDYETNTTKCIEPMAVSISGITAVDACGCSCEGLTGCADVEDWRDTRENACS